MDNPFSRDTITGSANCGDESAGLRRIILDRCTKGNIGRSGSCTTARRGLGVCIANPFDTDCDSDTYFKDYAVQARAARVEFCNIPANNEFWQG